MTTTTLPPISEQEAEQLCAAERAANQGHWFSAARWQCWGCMTFGGRQSLAKRCIGSQPGWRGCALVNRRLTEREQT